MNIYIGVMGTVVVLFIIVAIICYVKAEDEEESGFEAFDKWHNDIMYGNWKR